MLALSLPNGTETPPHISVTGAEVSYDGRPALDGVDLTFARGEMVGIIGRNGSGKSTLLKLIGRLLAPGAGAVYLDGKALASMPMGELARNTSVLPQAPAPPAELTVRELVGYGRYPHVPWLRRLGVQDHTIIEGAIEACRLEDLADRRLDTLSGGERQKAWVAMALAQQPRVMLLDEPVTFLDLGHQLEVMDLVGRLNRDEGITVVAVMHDLNLAARYCERLVALKAGRVCADGPTAEVMSPTVLREVFGIEARIGRDPVTGRPGVLPVPIYLRLHCAKVVTCPPTPPS